MFGDGAGIVALKRLPDALAAGDRILAVIRGVGLSSDGKSPSINVPQVKGQGLAIQNAYERSGVDTNTIQYVEAHATAAPPPATTLEGLTPALSVKLGVGVAVGTGVGVAAGVGVGAVVGVGVGAGAVTAKVAAWPFQL